MYDGGRAQPVLIDSVKWKCVQKSALINHDGNGDRSSSGGGDGRPWCFLNKIDWRILYETGTDKENVKTVKIAAAANSYKKV